MYTKEQMEKCFEAGVKFGRDMFNNPSNSEYIAGIPQQKVKNLTIPCVTQQREQFDNFYAWLDGLAQDEYDDMSLTDKCEKFFFKN